MVSSFFFYLFSNKAVVQKGRISGIEYVCGKWKVEKGQSFVPTGKAGVGIRRSGENKYFYFAEKKAGV